MQKFMFYFYLCFENILPLYINFIVFINSEMNISDHIYYRYWYVYKEINWNFSGLHNEHCWWEVCSGNIGSQDICVGCSKHGTCKSKTGIVTQVPDQMHQSVPEQAGLCIEFDRGSSGRRVSGQQSRGPEKEICLQMS